MTTIANLTVGTMLLFASFTWSLEAQLKANKIGAASQYWLEVKYTPSQEPISGIDLSLQLASGLNVSSVSLVPAQSGVWSQIKPVLSQNNNTIKLQALSPLMLSSRDNSSVSMFQLHIALESESNALTSADVIENLEVVKALNPAGEEISAINFQLGEMTSIKGKISRLEEKSKINYQHLNRLHSISFNLAKKMPVQVRIMDLKGNMVKQIVNTELAAGMQKITWNGTDGFENPASAGVYFMQLEMGSSTYNKKVRHNP